MTERLRPLPRLSVDAEPAWACRMSQGWNALSVYLPVVFMGLLALGSYWVVGRAPALNAPAIERPTSIEPSYTMSRFVARTFTGEGRLQTEIRGETLRRFPQNDHIEMEQVDLRQRSDNGPWTTARAQQLTTDDRQVQFTLTGNVVVVRDTDPRIEFRGNQVMINTESRQVVASQPVMMQRGDDTMRADSMTLDDASGRAWLQGRVRATLAAWP